MLSIQEETGKFDQVISGLLQDKIEEKLEKNEQIILIATKERNQSREAAGDSPQASSIRPLPLERAVWNELYIEMFFR